MKHARLSLVTLALLAASLSAQAVMPPYYEARAAMGRIEAAAQQRAQASDVVQLRVEQVQVETEERDRCPSLAHWRVTARVISVARGALAPDQRVQLRYTQERYLCPGPIQESMPVFQNAQTLHAYLNCQDSVCEPAAAVFSFLSDSEFQQEKNKRQAAIKQWPRP